MGHYDTCREGYCPGCGQGEGVIWACGHEGCTKYHTWLRQNGHIKELNRILTTKREREERWEEERVIKRQIARRTKQLAEDAKKEAMK